MEKFCCFPGLPGSGNGLCWVTRQLNSFHYVKISLPRPCALLVMRVVFDQLALQIFQPTHHNHDVQEPSSQSSTLIQRCTGIGVPRRHARVLCIQCSHAARKMRVGPSESACRSRLQTTLSCCGKEPWW